MNNEPTPTIDPTAVVEGDAHSIQIPEPQLISLDVTQVALFVSIDRQGETTIHATIPKRDAAAALHRLAAIWDNEWKTEARAAQKALRDAKAGSR